MMSFEEQFPSIKDIIGDDRVVCVTIQEVQRCCLDRSIVKKQYLSKQRVYEVLKDTISCGEEFFEICERLGIEDLIK